MAKPPVDRELTRLYELHYPEVLAYCIRRIGRAEADDATAECLQWPGGVGARSNGKPAVLGYLASLAESWPICDSRATGVIGWWEGSQGWPPPCGRS